ncbi:tether containing ubx domain for glut4 [Stylonychia lemnae]|uniref:Tether containing ubx domain for glut4 n=1 Tax=Stylonychia lemnae TaxID=5949 RepID=A0A077ZXP8_STYLE|nr:tether containing ubx domain for glut4 [Stylonychia lemnae]|eukprot:CDW74691.1 tether containing ubx domain for glut4 [Stylonychia lemnae]
MLVLKTLYRLEDNWLDTIDSLKQVTDSQWTDLKFPMGVVNQIKKKLSESSQPAMQQNNQQSVKQQSNQQDQEMIDTTTFKQNQQPISKEELKKDETVEYCLNALTLLQNETGSNVAQHRDTVKTLFTVLNNLLSKPLEPTVRRLNKTNKSVQAKVLAFKGAVQFLQIIGFDFKCNPEQIELNKYDQILLDAGMESINAHVISLGGEIESGQQFNPYKSVVSSTTSNKMPVIRDGKDQINFYDPNQVNNEIQKIQNERMKALKSTKVTDRDIKVFNVLSTGTNLKGYLMELDRLEQERLRELKISQEKLEEAIASTQALKLMAENEKSSHFRNKRQEELERLQKMQVYTTALVRIRFPDDYVIQGTFGALENIQVLYDFVQEHLYVQGREFYLYETPPKKIMTEMKQTLKQVRMVPSGMLYFGWTDLDQTKNTDGPFLDIAKLKDKILAF